MCTDRIVLQYNVTDFRVAILRDKKHFMIFNSVQGNVYYNYVGAIKITKWLTHLNHLQDYTKTYKHDCSLG